MNDEIERRRSGYRIPTRRGRPAEPVVMTLWFDVEDLIGFYQYACRPTGIQRVTFEICREVWRQAGTSGKVRFCRHGTTPDEYFLVDWPELEAGIMSACSAEKASAPPLPQAPGPAPAPAPRPNAMGRLHMYLAPRLTPSIRLPLGRLYRSGKQFLLALRDLVLACVAALRRPGRLPIPIGDGSVRLAVEKAVFAPGDVFVALGAPWGALHWTAGRHVKQQYGLRLAMLVYDLIPQLYPEWTSSVSLAGYRAWLTGVVPHADLVFAISDNTARDFMRHMRIGNRSRAVPVVLPMGNTPPQPLAVPAVPPFERPFVLLVSTIEVRKNHALMFRVWRRLLETLPAERVPYLVFAGKPAWLTGDLMAQLDNAGWLDGFIKLVDSPSEPELAALYETCLFTVFPSLYEGWGLPLTESLSYGKVVAASNRASIPEAGGEFCVYFDPENLNEATSVVRGLIENPARLRALEARIRERFRPPAWADTASVLLENLLAAGEQAAGEQAARKEVAAAAEGEVGAGA